MKNPKIFERINEKRNFKIYPAMCAFSLAIVMSLSACSIEQSSESVEVTFGAPDGEVAALFNPIVWDYEGEVKDVKIEKQSVEIEISYDELQELLGSGDEIITISDGVNTFDVSYETLYDASLKAEDVFETNHSNFRFLINKLMFLPSTLGLCVLVAGVTIIVYQKVKSKKHQR